jgi:hypothetical protein
MKQTVSKIISGLMMSATFALVVSSCQKEQNARATGNLNEAEVTINSKNANTIPAFSICAEIPDSLKVPEGNKFVLQTFARGVQIYEVQRSKTDPNVFQWVNIAPSATLYLRPDFTNEIIDHSAGPSWQFTKGPSKGEIVVAKRVQGVTKDATAIQWLLLEAVDALSSADNKITYIQRICTRGGLAPTTGADEAHLGQIANIPYTASYLFYTANH